ncbi:MAG: hypothetical protein PUH88_09260 [Lachnospiraceae bacterium]|nr:hypothetical protein [Lachnospiraceae bacterium]
MSMEYVTKFAPKTDELFKAESKKSLLTNTDYDWTGAHSVKVWKVTTASMNDYARNVNSEDPDSVAGISRYGKLFDLNSQTEEMMLKKDRSFIFNIDRLDQDETAGQVEAESALARQLREVVIPEVDKYVYNVMAAGAGKKANAVALTKDNIYSYVLAGSEYLDDKEVPDTERVLVVTPASYTLLKQATEFDSTDIGADLKIKGVVSVLDGMQVVKIPGNRLPDNFGFMIAHPSATVAPTKLEDYGVHNDTPLSSGTIVTGRICYDAFVLDNKKDGIYYQPTA